MGLFHMKAVDQAGGPTNVHNKLDAVRFQLFRLQALERKFS